MLEDFERSRVEAFFRKIADRYVTAQAGRGDRGAKQAEPDDLPSGVSAVAITHLLAERPVFLRAVARVARVAAVLPKPRSVNEAALAEISGVMPVDRLERAAFADGRYTLAFLESRAARQSVVLLDVGGYFAPSLAYVCEHFSGQVAGVVEDTENGYQRYAALSEALGKLPCPVVSVARSPLKDPEDYLVGQSVIFSAEALIRSRGDILNGRPAAVIGYGKLGRSIAAMLHAKHVAVTVYDCDPVRRTQALSQGYRSAPQLADALAGAGLIVCATGNLALREEDFALVANGAYIASVTSSDDELELAALDGLYERTPAGEHVTRYARTGHYFYVLADGNAVNFLHGASVGAFIFLVQAEILAALSRLASAGTAARSGAAGSPGAILDAGLHELDATDRSFIAATWLHYFDGT